MSAVPLYGIQYGKEVRNVGRLTLEFGHKHLQEYLADKQQPPPQDHHEILNIVLP